MLKAETLIHGGIMVNYRCNAACRHCLYSCSPTRGDAAYMDEESAEEICRLLREGGCRSVHLGGGEPFLNFDGLIMMIRKLKSAHITLDYVETNAFWADGEANQKDAREKLARLIAEGAGALCISIDPYHAEYVPYGAPLALAQLCEKAGMDYFLWKREFLPALSRLDSARAHSREEMEAALSPDYIERTARAYGIGYGGRAINIERETGALRGAEHFTADNTPCRGLLSTGHFHVDLNRCFIPPHCTGIRIPLAEVVRGISEGTYPAFEALYQGGVASLTDLARERGFTPDPGGYASKCAQCFYLRRYLACKDGFPELDRNHYVEAFKYYS